MGQIFRKVLIDVFREAQQTGDVPPGFNPAEWQKNRRCGYQDSD